jgi:hypothetical protein
MNPTIQNETVTASANSRDRLSSSQSVANHLPTVRYHLPTLAVHNELVWIWLGVARSDHLCCGAAGASGHHSGLLRGPAGACCCQVASEQYSVAVWGSRSLSMSVLRRAGRSHILIISSSHSGIRIGGVGGGVIIFIRCDCHSVSVRA